MLHYNMLTRPQKRTSILKKVPGENARPPYREPACQSVPLKTCFTPESNTTSDLVKTTQVKSPLVLHMLLAALKQLKRWQITTRKNVAF